jgi:predicted CoA-binding protein
MEPTVQAAVQQFLSSRRIALVGFSRNPKDFSRVLDTQLRERGYVVVPVHPELAEVDGRPAFPRVGAIAPEVDAALVMVPPSLAETVVRECLDAGVRRIWLHRGAGKGSASQEAIDLCRSRGVTPVRDLCPMMALPGASWPHRLHGWLRRRGHQTPAIPSGTTVG